MTLRPPYPTDQAAFLSQARASLDFHRPWASPPIEADQYAAYLERAARDDVATFLALRKEDGAIVALVSLSQIFYGSLRGAYLGYSAFASSAGRGYTTEAVRLVLAHGFADLGLHRIEANVQPGNERSLALLRRCGFRREGFSPSYLYLHGAWRDHERWALLEDEWRDARGDA